MSSDDSTAAAPARPTVFLSYATQDRPAARALQQALASFDLEVWLDESELGGGDAWDQKIRRQIRECQFFMPIISAQTEARVEGYFRREWRLAVERSLDMADDHLFLLPVVIDGTDQSKARVPEKFLAVQWLKVPDGRVTPALEALCRRLASGQTAVEPTGRKAAIAAVKSTLKTVPEFPPYPSATPDQKMPHWLAVAGWGGRMTWAGFQRMPRWVRVLAYVWVGLAMLSLLDSKSSSDATDVTQEKVEKIAAIAENYKGSENKLDIAKLGEQVAREFARNAAGTKDPLLAIPFSGPAGDAGASKLADTAFAMVYGRIALARHGHVALSEAALPSVTIDAALEQARLRHASYVLFGSVENPGAHAVLDIKLADVEDKAVLWTKSYAVAGADATKIAAEVEGKVPSLEE